jgi:hypothetical protein
MSLYLKNNLAAKYGLLLLLLAALSTSAWGQAISDSLRGSVQSDSSNSAVKGGWISVQSNPEGAEVFEGEAFLGRTPLKRETRTMREHVLTLFYPSAKAWNPVVVTDSLRAHSSGDRNLTVDLRVNSEYGILRTETHSAENNPDLFLAETKDEDQRLWMQYASGATMIVSGALSAYLKNRANNDFDKYVATRDPNLLASTRRLDRWAGVSLVVSEISFGVLIYFFVRNN